VIAAGLALALLSAFALNWAFFRQHDVASGLPPLSIRRPLASLRALFGSPRWLVGFAVGIAGWAAYVAALRLAPLSLVQATAAGGIGVLALLVRAAGTPLSRRESTGVIWAVAGLAALGISLAGGASAGSEAAAAAVAVWCLASAAAAGMSAGPLARALAPGAGLGIAAGLLYAAGDVATKQAVAGGAELAFVPVLLACHGLAFVALQLGFQRGGALATAGIATVATNALPILAGTTLFGEGLPDGPLGLLRLLAFGAVVVGAAAIAGRGEPQEQASGLTGAVAARTID
jgi:hypothetical protein